MQSVDQVTHSLHSHAGVSFLTLGPGCLGCPHFGGAERLSHCSSSSSSFGSAPARHCSLSHGVVGPEIGHLTLTWLEVVDGDVLSPPTISRRLALCATPQASDCRSGSCANPDEQRVLCKRPTQSLTSSSHKILPQQQILEDNETLNALITP